MLLDRKNTNKAVVLWCTSFILELGGREGRKAGKQEGREGRHQSGKASRKEGRQMGRQAGRKEKILGWGIFVIADFLDCRALGNIFYKI